MIALSYRGFAPLPATDEEPTWYSFPAPGEAREACGRDSREEPPAPPLSEKETPR